MLYELNTTVDLLLELFNYLGLFAFAISGAAAGIRRQADLFGIAILAFSAACFGGIIRDVLIGSLPPANIMSWEPLATSLAATAATVLFYPYLAEKFNNPVQVFDAIGLGLFTVIGAEKALVYGVGPVWAVLLGMVTAVGGGMVRDILLAEVPFVLKGEIYATAAVAGGAIAVAGYVWPLTFPPQYTMVLGAAVCIVLRCLTIKYHWGIPTPRIRHK
ncbi:MAG: trimeric intracellular cation channel family protein [Desulfovibrionaceae bacterium]|nr:trimeric intracellular cation channel family protein [Desulfovibrionaceae bacterium]